MNLPFPFPVAEGDGDRVRLLDQTRLPGEVVFRECRSVADVNHTVALWQNLHARFTEQTGLQHPPISTLDTLMRKPKKQVPPYLAALRSPPSNPRARRGPRLNQG